MRRHRRLLLGAVGAAAAQALLRSGRTLPAPARHALERTNHRGAPVSLVAGPVLTAAATGAAYAGGRRRGLGGAALTAGLLSGAVGLYDDLYGAAFGASPGQPADKGFRGHLRALREGRVSSGLVKIVGVGAAGLLAARPLARGPADTLVTGAVIAGAANLVNLLDLRPGRALKAGLLAGAPLLAGPAGSLVAGPVGAAAALLPADLDERVMLGDAGANALGALLGLGLAATAGRAGRAAALAGLIALTAASERVSFTAVIERTPGLRELDALGRHP